MATAEDVPIGVQYPTELSYPLPVAFPPGIKQMQLRQINYNTIPAPTAQGTEIQIIIPQLDGCFLDPSTTYINVKGRFEFQLSAAVNGDVNNGALMGSGWSLFQRYQVYANNTTLIDDINEVGALAHNMFKLNLDAPSRAAMAGPLGFSRSSDLGYVAGGGTDTYSTAPFTLGGVTAAETTTGAKTAATTDNHLWNRPMSYCTENQYTNLGMSILGCHPGEIAYKANDNSYSLAQVGAADISRARFTSSNVPAYATGKTWYQDFNFALPLMGVLGSGADKMYPLFIGPTRISLYLDSASNIIFSRALADNSAACSSITTTNITISSLEFVGNYLRCDPGSISMIMGALPSPMQFVIRSTTFAHCAVPISSTGFSGTFEGLISTRRASTKFLLASMYHSNSLHGKFCSVNPNLCSGSCIVINGQMYPQQGIDPQNKPEDYWMQVLSTLNTSTNTGMKPSVIPANYLVASSGFNGMYTAGAGGVYSPFYRAYSIAGTSTNYPNSANHPQIRASLVNDYWPFLIDTEHFSRRGFLSGTSTSNGSCFMRLIINPVLPAALNINVWNYHDMIVVCDYNLRATSVKV